MFFNNLVLVFKPFYDTVKSFVCFIFFFIEIFLKFAKSQKPLDESNSNIKIKLFWDQTIFKMKRTPIKDDLKY